MLHVLTVHHDTDRFVDLQTEALRRHVRGPYKAWAILSGSAAAGGNGVLFDEVIEGVQSTEHATRLDALAKAACSEADPEDVLLFLDGDAWPIADLTRRMAEVLERNALWAVRRDEGSNGGWPHPCFCAVRVKSWLGHSMSWRVETLDPGVAPNALNRRDVGVALLKTLERENIPWEPILRTSSPDLHPLFFGVYGDIVYHHGAGFRAPQWMAEGHDPAKLRQNAAISGVLLGLARHDPEFWRHL